MNLAREQPRGRHDDRARYCQVAAAPIATATMTPMMSPVGVPPPLSLSGASAPTSRGSGDGLDVGSGEALLFGVAFGPGVALLIGCEASLAGLLAPGSAVDTPVVDCEPPRLPSDFVVVVPLPLLPPGEG